MSALSRFTVARPVFTSMATLIVLVLGSMSLSRLPIDLMPDITYPTLSIRTSYENAGPREVETLITRPLEQALAAVPGVEEITSTSSEGQSDIRVTFVWGTDLDAAANDLRDRLDRILGALPDDADRPVLRKFDLASFPVLIMGASSQLDPIQMRNILENDVRYRLERVPGVAALDIWGGLEREIHVDLLPDRILALGIPLDQIIARIKESNLDLPAGVVETGDYEISIRTPGEYRSLDELGATIVAVREGPILLRDIAAISDSWQRISSIVRVNGEPGIRLSVSKQSGANTVQVVDRVMAELERISQDIPQVRITPIIDTSLFIKRSISNVANSTLYGGLFAVLVLLFFLRNVRATMVVAAAIPISIIATFMLIYFGGFTLNLMTLGGLALGVGMLVDNAIVVLENIQRLREQGVMPRVAAVQGADEVSGAITASTLTTLVVFLPVVFMRGMSGLMFKELAYVVGFALLCSLGVALTSVPMLASLWLTPAVNNGDAKIRSHNPFKRLVAASGAFFQNLETTYVSLLKWSLRHRPSTLLLALALLIGGLALVPLIGTEMMPATDEGEVRVEVEMEVGTRLALLDEVVTPMEELVRREVPEAKNVITMLGGGGFGRSQGSHSGQLRIGLVTQSQRTRGGQEIAAFLRGKFGRIPGALVRTRANQSLFIMRMISGGEEQVQVEIRGYDLDAADLLAQDVERILKGVDGITDTRISRSSGAPERAIHVDRVRAETFGVSVQDVADMLKTMLSGSTAGNFRDAGDEYPIVVRLQDAEQADLDELLDLALSGADGPVVLRNLVDVSEDTSPVSIERKDQERIVTVSGNLGNRDLGSVMADARQALEQLPVPQGFTITFGGDYEDQQESFRELALALGLALVLVYMVMACLYESLRDPFVVMFSVPLAIVGVSLMLFLTNTTFNMQSLIGCVMLGGILVNNAILLVDQTNMLRRKESMAMTEAIMEAGRRRLRPILMTSLTTIFGLLPMALGVGEGGEAQAPMARAVIGGLTSSTLITLVVVPVVYSYLAKKTSR